MTQQIRYRETVLPGLGRIKVPENTTDEEILHMVQEQDEHEKTPEPEK